MKFFLNTKTTGHLRGMEKEFGESANAIRLELNRLAEAGLLTSEYTTNKRIYRANAEHPLYDDINNILKKVVGIDQLVQRVTSQIGNLERAYLTGSFASGVDSGTIEMALVGNELDTAYIDKLIHKTEKLIGKAIVYIMLTEEQMSHFFNDKPTLLIWKKDLTAS